MKLIVSCVIKILLLRLSTNLSALKIRFKSCSKHGQKWGTTIISQTIRLTAYSFRDLHEGNIKGLRIYKICRIFKLLGQMHKLQIFSSLLEISFFSFVH